MDALNIVSKILRYLRLQFEISQNCRVQDKQGQYRSIKLSYLKLVNNYKYKNCTSDILDFIRLMAHGCSLHIFSKHLPDEIFIIDRR